jgi:hypothetical protein
VPPKELTNDEKSDKGGFKKATETPGKLTYNMVLKMS